MFAVHDLGSARGGVLIWVTRPVPYFWVWSVPNGGSVILVTLCRYWGGRKEYIYQTDENHSRPGVLGER